jgi:hypothetical protein
MKLGKTVIASLMVVMMVLVVGCGKTAKESGGGGGGGGDPVDPEYTFLSSTSNPRIALVRHYVPGYTQSQEHVAIVSDVTINIQGYTVRNTTGNIQSYTFFSSYDVGPSNQIELYSEVPSMFDGGGAFGWGQLASVWVKGSSYIELVSPSSTVIQAAQL